jgi:hypothetical protein
MAGHAYGTPLRIACGGQRRLQRGQINLEFRPLRGLPEEHEAYSIDLRLKYEA